MRGDSFPQVTYTLFDEIASNVFHLSFLARHPWTCVAQEQCLPPLVNSGKACKLNNFDSLQGANPTLILVWTIQPSFEIGKDTYGPYSPYVRKV